MELKARLLGWFCWSFVECLVFYVVMCLKGFFVVCYEGEGSKGSSSRGLCGCASVRCVRLVMEAR